VRDETLVRRKLGDRRGKPRFDIVGELSGTLESVLRLPMENISSGGALVQSHMMLPLDSIHKLTLNAGAEDFTTPVKVRYIREAMSADGERSFFIGLEFLSLHPVLLGHITQWMEMTADEAGEL
jgi:hypothetical protein